MKAIQPGEAMLVSTIQPLCQTVPFKMLPIYQPNDIEYADNKDNEVSNIQTAVVALTQFNHFLQSGRLSKLLLSEFGFHQHNCQILVSKHFDDLFHFNFPFVRGAGPKSNQQTRQQKLTKIGDTFTAVIQSLEMNFNLTAISASKARFVVPRGEQLSTYLLQQFPKSFVSDLHALLTNLERTMRVSAGVFAVQQAFFHTHYFVDLVDGLIHPENFGGLEPFVRDKFENNIDYFVMGYANDLLVNDKRDIINKVPIKGIYAKKGNCSTRVIYADNPPGADLQEYPINIFDECLRLERKLA